MNLSTVVDKTRNRRTAGEIVKLENQIHRVLALDHPQSVRHVFYRMTDPRLPVFVEKSEHGYRQIQHRITEMRRHGRLPYGWIVDATRRGYFVNTFTDKADFIRSYAGMYRADLWSDADVYCEVWAESRSIAGVIEATCKELAVSLYPAGGFTSLTLAYEAAGYINAATVEGEKPAHIFYIGDYDPAGVLIDQAIERELRTHLDPRVELHFQRLGITEAQIEQYDLPTKPRKAGDRRSPHVKSTVEAEAMPAGILRTLLRENVEVLLPPGALEIAKIAEQEEQAGLRMLAESLEVGDGY